MNLNLKTYLTSIRQQLSWNGIKAARFYYAMSFLLYFLFSWVYSSGIASAVVAVVIAIAVDRLRSLYAVSLEKRVEDVNGPTWDVYINQICTGTIMDSEYALIRLRTLHDNRVYVAQLGNLLRIVFRAFDHLFLAIPIALFWIGVVVAVFSPATLSNLVSAVQSATPDDIKHAVPMIGSMLIVVMVMVVMLYRMLGLSNFGFINHFEQSVHVAVRQHCVIASEGRMELMRVEGEIFVYPSELAFLRRSKMTSV